MKVIKETPYLIFAITAEKPKTKVITIFNKSSQDDIATIEWYSYWRQYCFFPGYGTVWSDGCLQDVRIVIAELNNDRVKQKELINQQIKP